MAKTKALRTRTAVRKSDEPTVMPRGYGSLKGQFVVRPGIDLTKPIYEQWLKLERKERRRRRQLQEA